MHQTEPDMCYQRLNNTTIYLFILEVRNIPVSQHYQNRNTNAFSIKYTKTLLLLSIFSNLMVYPLSKDCSFFKNLAYCIS